jgi:hypothetical protein
MNWRPTPEIPTVAGEAAEPHLDDSERSGDTTDASLPSRQLILVRYLLGAVASLALIVFIASLTIHFDQLRTVCRSSICVPGQLTPATLQTLHHLSISADGYALFRLLTAGGAALVSFAVAAVLVWRRSDQLMALLVAFMLVMFGVVGITNIVADTSSFWRVPAQLLSALSFPTYFAVIMVFPNGRFVPRWTRWLALAFLGLSVTYNFVPVVWTNNPWLTLAGNVLFIGLVATVPAAQIYRYRHVSTPVAQQQTKWVVFGLTAGIVLTFVPYLLAQVVSPLNQPGSLYPLLFNPDVGGSPLDLLLPLSFGIAILRYQLWDIDHLINRTLVYGSLTVLLAGVYFGLVLVLQLVVGKVTGRVSSSPLIIVASTLAIAALFEPLRHRVQVVIDRQFYRRKYDAARILAGFSAALANEVDLEQVTDRLMSVVDDVMQPVHVSVWLRKPARREPSG